ncbi:sigma 54-interacting transcriptional regulator [Klebsiella sp. 92007]|uniref:sigma-54-dependent transcriptional regulator n=1 Tax=Klebsiella sp. 92007 TaxID=3079127 RepID=UPI003007ED77
MSRKTIIFNCLTELEGDNPQGMTTEFIASYLGLSRANVSADLNQLVKEGMLEKTHSRPVHYHTISKKAYHETEEEDPFNYLIGYRDSLSNQVSQAKSAVIYPPHGLHTLLTGDTGVGKSLFASLMYNYAVYKKRLNNKAPFIIFNCADYANNPQLLVSHIFGHSKGSFTGAEKDKQGLICEADGGMLFLDEVHRLPPEGQEMIFYFMDTGSYGLLGETQRNRRAEILLVCATTEDPDSTLLSTFLRRIPITIHLPSLSQRSPDDQVELLKFIFSTEAQKIGCSISIDAESSKAIIGASYQGNVGKLKSTIQSVCAHFYYNQQHKRGLINITFESLALNIKTGIFNLKRDNEYLTRLQRALGEKIEISSDVAQLTRTDIRINKNDTPFQVYDVIDKKIYFMLEQNFSDTDINRFITTEINNYLSLQLPSNLHELDHGISPKTLELCQSLKSELEIQLGNDFSEGFLLSLGFHLDNLLSNKTQPRTNNWARRYRVDKLKEYELALTIKKRLYKEEDLMISDDEVSYLTILLSSLVVRDREKRIHVIVATHGDMIASNMADIAKALIAEDNISAVNMPLNIKPNQAIEQIKQTILSTPNTREFLLLVDMGSLLQAGSIISQQCDISVRTLDMVSTPLVIEALRRTVLVNAALDDIYYSLMHFKGYGADKNQRLPNQNKPQAILAICSSGKGIAQKLQQFLRAVLDEMERKDIHILNMSVDEAISGKQHFMSEYQLLLSVGVTDLHLDIPHIPLTDFFTPKGELAFQTIIGGSYVRTETDNNPVTLTKLSEQYLQEFLVFLNPRKIVPMVMSFLHTVKELRELEFGNGLLNFCVHICMALERSVRNENICYDRPNRDNYLSGKVFAVYQVANTQLENKIGVKLSDDELLYIIDMLEKDNSNAA